MQFYYSDVSHINESPLHKHFIGSWPSTVEVILMDVSVWNRSFRESEAVGNCARDWIHSVALIMLQLPLIIIEGEKGNQWIF